MKQPNMLVRLLMALIIGISFGNMAQDAAGADNVVVLLDSSGSMGNHLPHGKVKKMDAAKAALRAVLNGCSTNTQIGLFVFGSKNIAEGWAGRFTTPYGWAYRLGPIDNQRLLEAIDKPIPGAFTPLGECMGLTLKALQAERDKEHGAGTYRLLVVTDDQADDANLVDLYVAQALSNNVVLDVIGVGMKKKHDLATKAHLYFSADDPEGLRAAVAMSFAEVPDGGLDDADKRVFDRIAPLPEPVAAAAINAIAKRYQKPPP
jgi:hypothetical protein